MNISIGKCTISGRPGTFRKTSAVDVTSKDDEQTYAKSQFGPGPGGVGKTTLKATSGSKGGQLLEENELPLGDESLPWRRKDRTKDSLSAQTFLDQIPKFIQAQPWTNEQIKLKESHRGKKDITKEILEVDSSSSETKQQDQMAKLIHTEDKTLIKVDKRESIQQSKTSQVMDWRKPRGPQVGIQKYSDTEESSILTIDEKEKDTVTSKSKDDLKIKDWRTKKQPDNHTEDISLLKISEAEETSQISRKPETLDVSAESIPWNQQQIILKKTPRERKEIPKEELEPISLKSTVPETTAISKEKVTTGVEHEQITSLRNIDDKHIIDITETEDENILQKKAWPRGSKFEEEKPKDQKLQVTEGKPEIPKQKMTTAKKEEESVPWNKQQIALKQTHKGRKEEILKETKLQETEKEAAQPLRNLKDEITIDVKENITQIKDEKFVVEDKNIKLETKTWRKDIIKKEEKESEVITEKAKEEEIKPLIPKQQITPFEKPEEPIPWNKEQITLKKIQKGEKEDKRVTEEIYLKTIQPKDKLSGIEDVPEIDEKGIKPLQHIEDKSIIDIKDTDTTKVALKEDSKLEIKSWRRGKIPTDEYIPKEEKPEIVEVPKETEEKPIETDVPKDKILPQTTKEEPIPWNKQTISLKKTVKEKKEQVTEQIEEVQLKLIKSDQIIQKEGLTETGIKETEIKHLEDKSISEIKKTEKITDNADETPQEEKLNAKPWRRGKVSIDEKTNKEVKPEITEDIPKKSEQEEIKPHKPKHQIIQLEKKEEPIPWNKDKITLKKTIKEKTEEVKEKIEEVQLEPITSQEKIIRPEDVTDIEIKEKKTKPLQHVEDKVVIDIKETVTEIKDLKDKTQQEIKLEIKSRRFPEDVKEEKPEETSKESRKLKQQIVPLEKKEEPIPWNQQKIALKKAVKEKTEEIKDTSEEIQLQLIKPEDKIIRPEDVSGKDIKEIDSKPLQHIEDKAIIDVKETDITEIRDLKDKTLQETKLETKFWRKEKVSVDEKTSKGEKPEYIEEKTKELEEEKIKPHKPKHQIVPRQNTDESIPWNQQKITLKKTQKNTKEEVKENIEEVLLKPVKPEGVIKSEETKQIQPEEIKKLDQKPSSSEEVVGDKSVRGDTSAETNLEVKPWRREKPKEKKIKEQKLELLQPTAVELPEKEKQEEIQPQLPVQRTSPLDKVDEAIPWNKQQITLKLTQKKKKDVKEKLEEIQSDATKLQENILKAEDIATELYKEEPTEVDKIDLNETERQSTEDKSVQEESVETKSWKRDKVSKKEQPTEEKTDVVEAMPSVEKPRIEDTKQDKLETKEWRRGKGPKAEKPKNEEPEIIEATPITDKTQIDDKKDEKNKISLLEKPDKILPWNKQSVVLKRTEKKEIEDAKEQMEEVLLKPLKPQTEPRKPQEVKATDIPSQNDVENKTVIETKQPEMQKPKTGKRPDLKPETKSWRRGERVKSENQQAEKPETIKLLDTEKNLAPKELLQQEQPLEEKPKIKEWEENKPELKSSDSKVTEQITPWTEETVTLKRGPKTTPTLQKKEVESITLKPLKKKEVHAEIHSEISSEEEKEVIIDKSKKKLKKKKKDIIPKDEKTESEQSEDIQVVEEVPSELEKIPEAVIVETVTEVQDTVVLKVTEEDIKKPKYAKKIEDGDVTLETIKLKPVSKVEKVEEQDLIEKVSLKSIPQKEIVESKEIKEKKRKEKKQKPEELPEIEDSEKYIPEVAEKTETEEIPKEKEEKPSVPWRREIKAKEEKPVEEKAPIKIGKGKLPDAQEIEDKVKLKPIKKDKITDQDIPQKTKHIKLPETDFELKEYEKQKIEPSEDKKEDSTEVEKMDKTLIPEENLQATEAVPEAPVPWRRTPKKKEEDISEVKEWPKGKRKPAPEEEKEQIQLKPISKENTEEPIYKVETEEAKRDFATEMPTRSYEDKIHIEPMQSSEQLDNEEAKRKSKKAKPKEESDIPETREWRRGKPKEKPEEVEEKPELLSTKIEDVVKVQKDIPETREWRRGKPKEEKPTAVEEKPELIPTKIEDVVEKLTEVPEIEKSETEIKLIENKNKHFIQKKTEKPSEEEEVQFQKELDVQISSKKVKTEQRKIVSFDDSQPIPELEIISQKRTTEVLDKVPDENLTEDVDVQEKTVVQKSIVHKTIGKRAKTKTIAPKFIQRVEPVVAERDKPALLTCTVEGTPFPEITWYKNEAVFHANERVSINMVENTVTLEFSKVEPQDVAVYSCKATNSAGVATSTANLVILGSYVLAVFFSFVWKLASISVLR